MLQRAKSYCDKVLSFAPDKRLNWQTEALVKNELLHFTSSRFSKSFKELKEAIYYILYNRCLREFTHNLAKSFKINWKKSYLVKLHAPVWKFSKVTCSCNFIKKETLAQVFSCQFCEIFKNTFFYRTPLGVASENSPNKHMKVYSWSNFPMTQYDAWCNI